MDDAFLAHSIIFEKTKPVQRGKTEENVHFASNTWEEKDVQRHVITYEQSQQTSNKTGVGNAGKATVPLTSILFPSRFNDSFWKDPLARHLNTCPTIPTTLVGGDVRKCNLHFSRCICLLYGFLMRRRHHRSVNLRVLGLHFIIPLP